MKNKWQALNEFWNGFGIPAYDENTVPDDAVMPYITYEASVGELDDKLYLMASLWYYSPSWSSISQKVDEISNYIGGGAGVPYSGGRLWVTKGTPFAQRMSEPNSDLTRRVVLQTAVEFQ